MSSYDGNYGETLERDIREADADRRDRETEYLDWQREQEQDRLRRDWPVTRIGGNPPRKKAE